VDIYRVEANQVRSAHAYFDPRRLLAQVRLSSLCRV
jgi:hypothetical protein